MHTVRLSWLRCELPCSPYTLAITESTSCWTWTDCQVGVMSLYTKAQCQCKRMYVASFLAVLGVVVLHRMSACVQSLQA